MISQRYYPFFFWSPWCKVQAIVQGRNWQYLGSWATNKKSKDTLLSQTLKNEEKKVALVFFYLWRYGHYFFWRSWCKVRAIVSGRNCQYLGSWATNKKSKDTLISQTLKFEEKKVTLVFWFVSQEPRYGLCVIFPVFPFYVTLWKKGGLEGALPSHLGV